MSKISKQIIDLAGHMYDQGIKGGWNKVAVILNDQGYRDNSGSELHGLALCAACLADEEWSHLRKNKVFSTNKRLLIMSAMRKQGILESDIENVMKNLPL